MVELLFFFTLFTSYWIYLVSWKYVLVLCHYWFTFKGVVLQIGEWWITQYIKILFLTCFLWSMNLHLNFLVDLSMYSLISSVSSSLQFLTNNKICSSPVYCEKNVIIHKLWYELQSIIHMLILLWSTNHHNCVRWWQYFFIFMLKEWNLI